MNLRQKTIKVKKSGKPSTSGLSSTERSRVRQNNTYADKMKHEREKLKGIERKRMAYALEAMKCESDTDSLQKK